MSFVQPAPQLGNQYRDDALLCSYLRRALDARTLAAIEPDLDALGQFAAEAWASARARADEEPILTQWDAWGNRIDRIELTHAWRMAAPLAAQYGLVAAGHESIHGAAARTHQFSLVYLYHCASEFHSCPLAMSDGAATAIKASGNVELAAHALPHLLSRDPARHWISGQWMTENAGGSDVSNSETVARLVDGQWRLYGRKWFASAINTQMALALARPEGAPPGADGLALFYLESRDAQGRLLNVTLDRLKHKLGTRELPTAEIHLDGAPARLVAGADHGVRAIAPMLNVTRTWNAVCAVATMRRALALAEDYAQRRRAFGKPLDEQPLHRATLANLRAQFEAAFHLAFHVAELLGLAQAGEASPAQQDRLRLLTPLAKLWTGKLAVVIASEACECFGGAGYLEDTGMPQLLRDAQVFPIWEGTTNVLALDFLRALRGAGGAQTLIDAQHELRAEIETSELARCAAIASSHAEHAAGKLESLRHDRDALEANARDIAFAFARGFALSLAARHADWAQRNENATAYAVSASRFADILQA
ncbi:MAG: acyl-CoA dehydrogenase family protein [Rudaea sp.]|uniref:acyl-CoA dehydrogenase family protein n=1 Tax=Rudaea sp. TaxID=2136325 RepID=UPI0039E5A4EF